MFTFRRVGVAGSSALISLPTIPHRKNATTSAPEATPSSASRTDDTPAATQQPSTPAAGGSRLTQVDNGAYKGARTDAEMDAMLHGYKHLMALARMRGGNKQHGSTRSSGHAKHTTSPPTTAGAGHQQGPPDPYGYDPTFVNFVKSNSLSMADTSVLQSVPPTAIKGVVGSSGTAQYYAASTASLRKSLSENDDNATKYGHSSPHQIGSTRATDRNINNRGKSSHAEGKSIWDEIPYTEKMETFECNNKHAWMDEQMGWCYLCEEPVGGSMGLHIGDRDHMCLHMFMGIFARYPHRVVSADCPTLTERAAKVLGTAGEHPYLRSVHKYAARPFMLDHLHTQADAMRRAEITSLIIHLCQAPHNAFTHIFHGQSEEGFWYSGERMYRREFTRLITQTMPPMSAGMATQFTHKCWGRTNLERGYDALCIADIKRMFGGTPVEDKDSKAHFMRLLMWNLLDTDVRSAHAIEGRVGNPHPNVVATASASRGGVAHDFTANGGQYGDGSAWIGPRSGVVSFSVHSLSTVPSVSSADASYVARPLTAAGADMAAIEGGAPIVRAADGSPLSDEAAFLAESAEATYLATDDDKSASTAAGDGYGGASSNSNGSTMAVDINLQRAGSSGGHKTLSRDHELTMELTRLLRRRLVNELVFLQTMQFMNKVQGVHRRMGYPTYEQLVAMNLI